MTATDPLDIDRCGRGRPHDPHPVSMGNSTHCAGLTTETYDARRQQDQRYEEAIGVCDYWSPIHGCCCQKELGSVAHGPVATPAEVFG